MFRSANDLGVLGNPILSGYSDPNYASDVDTRRSTSGSIFMLAGAPISWQRRAQATAALSSTEADYIALAGAVQEAIWFLQALREFKAMITAPVLIYEDNQSTIKFVENLVFHKRSKHVDIKYHFISMFWQRILWPIFLRNRWLSHCLLPFVLHFIVFYMIAFYVCLFAVYEGLQLRSIQTFVLSD